MEQNGNNPEQAFSPEGIEQMNKNITSLNNGKFHQPIYKVRTYEQADKFAVGQTGNKSTKFVEAAKVLTCSLQYMKLLINATLRLFH